MSTVMSAIRILVVENHPAVCEALRYQLDRHEDLAFAGEAATVEGALAQIDMVAPDVAVVDVALQDGNGIDLVKRIRAQGLSTKVLIWSMFDARLYADRARRAGAQGYITKEHPTAEIVAAIRRIYRGETVFQEAKDTVPAQLRAADVDSLIMELSDRELEVFRLLGEGLDMTQISHRLGLSVKTTETYRARIKQKLNIENRMELIHIAVCWVINHR